MEARKLSHDMLDILPEIADGLKAKGLDHPMVNRLRDILAARTRRCLRALAD